MVEKLKIKRQRQKFRGYREYIDRERGSRPGSLSNRGVDGIPLEMVLIPDGTFTMGAPEKEEGSRSNERPQHNVTISAFLMGRYPITQAQWKAIAQKTDLKINQDLDPDPSHFKEPYQGRDRWQRPVEQVNWYEAVEFCQRLSKLTGRNYRLPSEAEWEYACRGVRESLDLEKGESYPPFHFGETITTELANYRGKDDKDLGVSGSYGKGPKGDYREQTTTVGYFKEVNPFGLSDMHGNVWEWCADTWHDNYQGAPNNGSAWLSGDDNRSALRGGSWIYLPGYCRSATRVNLNRRDYRDDDDGFRVVCG
ncbi:MAG: formylglycine-generating enzyme family protein [Xenococcaceae cyanobacterium MO_167.B27]|nr:formylglycine-generating enzyme family protein [Xenococcaceae cyanobacterium MO_167.B27]